MEKEKDKNVDIFEDDPVESKKKDTKKDHKDISKLESEIKILREENDKLLNEKTDLNNKYLSSLAETKNYKKRMDEEMDRFYKYSTFSLCKELVQILDSFDLALEKDVENKEMIAYLNGFKLTRNQIYSILEKEGVKEIEALGKEFNPNEMVSISHMEDRTKKDQEVLRVFMKGYMYKDRVLRPANVIINLYQEAPKENEE
ncbi:nucleotide exchange factor GrpE [bacterium]|nr:nucleotide exchange factor GrpE [bacterium]